MSSNGGIAGRLYYLFRGSQRAHGEYRPPVDERPGEKVEGNHYFPDGPVTLEMWQQHLLGKRGVGIVPVTEEGTCCWGAIDVDLEYAADESIPAKYEDLLRVHRLPLLPLRSKSGGCHLFIFFNDPMPAKTVRRKLREWAIRLGLPESTEIFPKQSILERGDKGSWLNMPYFGALSGTTNRYAVFEHKPLDLENFCSLAERLARTAAQILQGDDDDPSEGPPCIEDILITGKTGDFRNNLLFNVGVYFRFKKLDENWETSVRRWNELHVKPPLDLAELGKILKSLGRKNNYNYRCKDAPICHHCNRDLCVTRKFGVGNDFEGWPTITDVVCYLADEPYFEFDMNRIHVRCDIEEISSQLRFRNLVGKWLHNLPPRVSVDRFEKFVNLLLAQARNIEVPPELSPSGQITYYLIKYLTGMKSESWEELRERDLPYHDSEEKLLYFRYPAFQRYLNEQRRGVTFTSRMTFAVFRTAGAKPTQVRVGYHNFACWKIPFEDDKLVIPPKHIEGEM
jgi:hypothetical protein